MTPAPQTFSDSELVDLYGRIGGTTKVARALHVNPEAIRLRLKRLGIARVYGNSPYTIEQIRRIRDDYARYRERGQLKRLAQEVGCRSVAALIQAAQRLGLGTKSFTKQWARRPHYGKGGLSKYLDQRAADKLLTRFARSRFGVAEFCARYGFGRRTFSHLMRERFPSEWDALVESKSPRQSWYRRGRDFEYRVKDVLAKAGFFVLRSPRSASPLDLVAVKRGTTLFVQCKRNGHLPPKEWNQLFDLAASVGVSPILASALKRGGGTAFFKLLDRKLHSVGGRQQPYGALNVEAL